jgi:lysyl-tRNA synthetase class 2
VISVQRHPLGPRVFVFRHRVHEYLLGIVVELALAAGWLVGALRPGIAFWAVAAAGGWLIAKDWQDLFPHRRDTACWSVGLHRRKQSLRESRRSDGLPLVAAIATLAVALVNIGSALTPAIPWRLRLLLHVEPVAALPIFQAAALPAGVALAIVAFYLLRRRRRALQAALFLLVVAGAVDLVKGLDFEEAALGWAVAGLLWWGRSAFYVQHERLRPSSVLLRLPLLAIGAAAVAAAAVWAATAPHRNPVAIGREMVALLTWSHGPLSFQELFAWVPLAVGTASAASLLVAAYVFFRPLAAPGTLPDEEARRVAFELVRAHGSDTLSFFKLRADTHHFFSADRRAFLGYRIENGVLLISGDPVGHPDAFGGLLHDVCAFAELRGLKVGAVGAGEALLPLYEQAGLRALYIGDEAVVDTRSFSLEGRAVRKVRQSVNRLTSAGYSASLLRFEELDESTRGELDRVSEVWRRGEPERGFSMAMDSLEGEHQADGAIVVARDPRGIVRAFLHFVPSYGRPAMSLSFMRRDPETPNGLTEFLVVAAIELLRERGIEELSLNFAALARLLRSPADLRERLLGRVVRLANPFFQLESLYRFTAKFSPGWEPRYLLYEGRFGMPRVGLATLRIEGQLPRPRLGGGAKR